MSEALDVARYIFINDEQELRCGWRALVFLLLFVLAELLLTGLIQIIATLIPALSFVGHGRSAAEEGSARRLVLLGIDSARDLTSAVVATAICARRLEHRSFASAGFKLHRGWLRDFLLGSLMGSSALAIAVGIAAVAGAVVFEVRTENGALLARGFAITFIFFLVAGAFEELLFRGFPFQALRHNLGGTASVGITAVIFGLLHLGNDGATAFSTINTILAGVWLGVAYLTTRSLWLAIALHYSWNLTMVFVFGLPVSGLTLLNQLSWLQGHPGPPVWVSGGSYGPEAGAGATAALILATLLIWKSGLFRASEEMLAALRHGKHEREVLRITPEDIEEAPATVDRTSLD